MRDAGTGAPSTPTLLANRAACGAAPLDVTVGVALRARTADVFAPEWRQINLRHGLRLPAQPLDLVLLELRDGQVPGWEKHETKLAQAVERWMAGGTPVLVWCTGGPIPGVSWLADVSAVAVTAESLAAEAREHHDRVLVLPAAAQPRIHRPGGPYADRQRALALIDGLAGLTDDAVLADLLAPALLPMSPSDLQVTRVRGKSSRVTLPPAMSDRVDGSSEWIDIQTELGRCRVGIDLSATSVDAQWSAVAMACSGAALVGADTLSGELPPELAALVPLSQDSTSLRSELVARVEQEELFAREGHRLQREVLNGHTAAVRAKSLMHAAGLSTPAPERSVSAIVPTNRTHEIDNILANVGRQSHRDHELVLVLHGLDISSSEITARANDAGVADTVVVHADAALTLGACMNLGVDASSGRYVAKMDDDNYYGEHYLADLTNAFQYTSAGIVGKWCHYVWLRSSGAVVLRYPLAEHTVERRIQGGSMLFEGDVVRHVRFSDIPRAVDSDILDRAALEGVEIYSADRYNFVSIRGADRLAHTWTVQDSTFMTKTGRLMFYGDPRSHVSV